jgi:alpha-glucosidase (family GH31 glycosyl hydrolase)
MSYGKRWVFLSAFILAIAAVVGLSFLSPAVADVQRYRFENKDAYLIIEVMNDKTFHFEVSAHLPGPSALSPLTLSPYISDQSLDLAFPGATKSGQIAKANSTVETAFARIEVQPTTLCLDITDKLVSKRNFKICPLDLKKDWKGLTFESSGVRNIYGLGEQFLPQRFHKADGDWVGQVRYSGGQDDPSGGDPIKGPTFGNSFVKFGGEGMIGNTQFPVMYATGDDGQSWMLFLDNIYKQRWDFASTPWKVQMHGEPIRFFLSVDRGLPELRKTFLSIVGRPLVPPKKAFGLWISEYGFENWHELEDKLNSLRKNNFPVDGFLLDLQWFGGIKGDSEDSRMGSLEFDRKAFPDPEQKIHDLWKAQGIGLVTIEESYVAKKLPEWKRWALGSLLARNELGEKSTPEQIEANAFYINENPWWGLGGMLDWTNPGTRKDLHLSKRLELVKMGIMGHWTDLGEPEMFRNKDGRTPYYFGGKNEADIHNIYNLQWLRGIFEGYRDSKLRQRPWILSRSGGPGMQRYGAGMWSGDIASNMGALATHYNVQSHMSMSGIDYFGADVGGFHREDLEPGVGQKGLNQLYEQWFANASAFDVPVRPHTFNLDNSKETAPDRIGHLPSNLMNIRLRYELSPYYYSLAHRAYLFGEPVVPPVYFYYQNANASLVPGFDPRTLGNEKLIGRDLLIALVANHDETKRDVYLPPGEWVDYRTGQRHVSQDGMVIHDYPLFRQEHEYRFELPVFARAGGIIPKMHVDDSTMNILGKRKDGVTHTELKLKIFPARAKSEFTVYEDDGTSIGYQEGQVAETLVKQEWRPDALAIEVAPTKGKYTYEDPNTGISVESPTERVFSFEFILPKESLTDVNAVMLLQTPMIEAKSKAEFDSSFESVWFKDGASGILFAKTKSQAVNAAKMLQIQFK